MMPSKAQQGPASPPLPAFWARLATIQPPVPLGQKDRQHRTTGPQKLLLRYQGFNGRSTIRTPNPDRFEYSSCCPLWDT